MQKFKVGARVRYIGEATPHWRGREGTVRFVEKSPIEAITPVIWDDGEYALPDTANLELILPQEEIKPKKLYVIGSLRNPEVAKIANQMRHDHPGLEVFDDWMAAGPEADDKWKDYETMRGRGLPEALKGYAAQHVFNYDKGHIDSSDAVLLVLPAGKSGHLELGYAVGRGKRTAILLEDDPERYDVMYGFVDLVTYSLDDIEAWIKKGFEQ